MGIGWLRGSFYPDGHNYGSPTPFMRIVWYVARMTIDKSNKLANDLPIAAITGLVIPFSDSKQLLNNLVTNIDALAAGQLNKSVLSAMAGNFSGLASETGNAKLKEFFESCSMLASAVAELVGS